MSHSGSSAANPQGSDYEVFLSFRGSDTRTGFTDFLYTSLVNAGIRAFRDNEELRLGEEIGDNLLEAISQSKISIPIFSKYYASSKWCLKEAAHMVKCRKTRNRNQLILPIFYDVTPDDVKNQSGTYEEALRLHSESYGEETAEEWRNALSEIGRLKGWELQKVADRHEGRLVNEVVSRVWRELQNAHLIIKDTIIGVEDKVDEVMKILDIGGSDVRIVGLYGIGGIGKTTLAKIIYNKLLEHFKCSSFLKDVREMSSQPRGLEKLQAQLVSDMTGILQCEFPHVDRGTQVLGERLKGKKALILLDDVDKKDQIDALAADLNWFAGGSRILITTRYKDVLDASQVRRKYEVKPMHPNEAFLLFCMHAFRRDSPIADYADLSRKIVATTGGLPLALEVIGSFLSAKRSRETWEDILEKLENAPHKDVQDKLKISYDALEPEHQQIFLDIACFFIGTDKRIAMYMWKDIGYYPAEGVEVLLAMSLIRIGDDYKFWMHDQLRDLGKEIVRNENIRELGKRSRLWSSEDARRVLENHEGTEEVKAIQLDYGTESTGYCFTREQFMNLSKLEFLRLGAVNVSPDIWCLLRKLRWLQWHCCPVELMETNSYLENLVILDLLKSNITEYWSGWSSRQLASKLQVLILESCQTLSRTPDLSKFLLLERLSFQDCGNLHKLDPSIGKLKNLIFLSLKNCFWVRELPQELGHLQALVELHIDGSGVTRLPPLDGLKKLKLLSAKGCQSLSEIPSSIGNLDSLLELSLDNSKVCTLPNSIQTLSKLKCLSLKDCKSLRELPDTIGQLTSLEKLFVPRTEIHTLPDSIGGLSNLQVLLVSRTKIMNLPSNLGMLGKLEAITAIGCTTLRGEILIDVERQSSLTTLKLERTNITMLPANINKLPHLKTLNLAHCDALQTLPQLPRSLEELWVTCKPMETFPDLSICKNLLELRLMECSKLKRIPGLGSLKNLKILTVSMCQELTELNSLENLECMGELSISCCESLEKLLDLPKSKQFKTLKVDSCKSLKSLPNLSALKMLRHLSFADCERIRKVEGLGEIESLEYLDMKGCKSLQSLPNLSSLKMLRHLSFVDCERICKVEGLGEIESLEYLDMKGCKSLQSLLDLSSSKILRHLSFADCEKLCKVELGEIESLEYLDMKGCKSLQSLSNLSSLKMLRHLSFADCDKLCKVEGLGEIESLEYLDMKGCKSLQSLPNLSSLKMLRHLSFADCETLCKVEGLGEIESLEYLDMKGCKSLQSLPNLSSLKMLKHLGLANCEKLWKVEGLGELESLAYLDMTGCKSLQSLPNISSLKMLRHLNLMKCEKLRVVEGIGELELLEYVNLTDCKAMEILPDLSKLQKLKELLLVRCKQLKNLQGLRCLKSLKQVDIRCSPFLYDCSETQPFLSREDLVRSLFFRSKRSFLNFSDQDIMDYVDTYRGVSAFRDDGEIGSDQLEAINESKIAIPIFTKGYASSIRCLNELIHIVECNKKRNLSIFPIFYDVAPDQVQEQSESYEASFKQHMNCYDANIVEGWRAALREVGALKGLELQHLDDEHKEKLIKQDLPYVMRNRDLGLYKYMNIVGIKDHVEEVMRLLEIDANEVRIVGIHGMSGVGKTTLATVIYNQLKERFVYCSFLADVRETSLRNRGIEELQGRLLLDMLRANDPKEFEFANVNEGINVLRHVDKKVLIVVDDVDHIDQLSALVPHNGQFVPGSRIIVTTRSKQVLDMYQVGRTYELNELQFSDALDLFHKHAFGMSREPPPDLVALSSDIVMLCGGLPSTLELIGSFLNGKGKLKWEHVLKELRKVHCNDVQSKLKICYDALDDEVQKTFLYAACFFIGMDCRVACNIPIGAACSIRKLVSLFLAHVDNNKLRMRDELRDLGREIVQQESYNGRGKGIRLWRSEETIEVLDSKQDTKRIEAVYLDCGYGSEDCCFESKQFKFLHNLRFLQLNKGNIVGNFNSLLRNLRCLRWHQCPVELMAANLYLEELVILDLSESDILDDWNGWSFVQKSFNLEVLILKSCQRLTKPPDLSAFPRLKMLILDDCKSLNFIDPSIGSLGDLQFLSMKGCSRFEVLPQKLSSLGKLIELHIDETCVKEIPTLKNVRVLSARKCEYLLGIPDPVGGLRGLRELNLSHTGIHALPDSIGQFKFLFRLDLSYSSIHALPDSIGELINLEALNMSGSNIQYLPTTLGKLERLEVINVSNCRNLNGEIVLQPVRLYSLTAFIMDGTNITLAPSISWLLHFPTLNLGIKRGDFGPVEWDPYWTELGIEPPGYRPRPREIIKKKNRKYFCFFGQP